MQKGYLRPRDRVALVAASGIVVSGLIWLSYAYLDSVVQRRVLSYDLIFQSPSESLHRLLAVAGVLVGTLAVQIIYGRSLDATERLRTEQSRIREMYENSPDAIISLDSDRRLIFANEPAADLARGDKEALLGDTCHHALFGLSEPCPGCSFEEVLASHGSAEDTIEHRLGDGGHRWYNRLIYAITGGDGSLVTVVETIRDVTELRDAQDALVESHRELERRIEARTKELSLANTRLRAEVETRERIADALAASEQRYRSIVDDAPDMVLVHDTRRISFVNGVGLAMLGLDDVSQAIGTPVLTLWEPNGSGLDREGLERAIVEGTNGRPIPIKLLRADGSATDVELSSTLLDIDGAPHVQCVVRDITERVRAQETIKQMAYYDALTGLPNRALFRDRLAQHIARARRSGRSLAVAFLDLDDFKNVNDTLGHSIGDGLLKAVAERLTSVVRDEDTVAHQSGDEFTIIAELREPGDVERLAERISEGLRPAFVVEGHELHVTTSMGLALFPEHGEDEGELLRMADTAMYRSKEWGHNQWRLYQPEMGTAAGERLRLEIELRHAIERREFVLHFQPQVDVRDGRIVGIEALIRWNHPERGLVAPDAFLGVAEQAGLVTAIGRQVLDEACRLASAWHARGFDFGRIAVNLSAREFLQHDLIRSITGALERSGLPAGLLELEITESVALHGVEQVIDTLGKLRALGVRIAIDDFGTGYSAMSYLQRFPIHTLKIAQTFMRDVCSNRESAAIAVALIDLCRILELDIVAEGVEDAEQIAFLTEQSCHVVQGYAYYRPMPAEQVTETLEQKAAAGGFVVA